MNKQKLLDLLSTSIYLLVIMVLAFLIIKYVGQRTEVVGRSMEPTLENEDNLIVDKITYRFSDPERFDIIVFPYKPEFAYYTETEPVYYIKRIIGMPGETVQIDEQGNIYINGEIDDETKLAEYVKFLKSENVEYNEKFPRTSSVVRYYKLG
mgnify:CR=1 FL=1